MTCSSLRKESTPFTSVWKTNVDLQRRAPEAQSTVRGFQTSLITTCSNKYTLYHNPVNKYLWWYIRTWLSYKTEKKTSQNNTIWTATIWDFVFWFSLYYFFKCLLMKLVFHSWLTTCSLKNTGVTDFIWLQLLDVFNLGREEGVLTAGCNREERNEQIENGENLPIPFLASWLESELLSVRLSVRTRMFARNPVKLCTQTRMLQGLDQEWVNYHLWAIPIQPSVFINQVLVEHSRTH